MTPEDPLAALEQEIAHLDAQIRTLQVQRGALKDQRAELVFARLGAHPVGAVIATDSAVGRVTGRKLGYDDAVTYAVVRLRKDGSEGSDATFPGAGVRLIAEDYDEAANHHAAAFPPRVSTEQRTPTDLAAQLTAHLRRMEQQQPHEKTEGQQKLWQPMAYVGGGAVMVKYIGTYPATRLGREEAGAYLDWLDAGNTGTHRAFQKAKDAELPAPQAPA